MTRPFPDDLKPGLHYKLAVIRGALNGQIRKTGEHTQGGPKYSFVEALEVGRQFVEAASLQGVTMIPESAEIVNVRPTTSGKQTVVSIMVIWRITDSETGESTTVVSFGEGADNSDKALPKAQTNAMKYAILMVLQAAGDDPEKDEPEPPARRAARRRATQRAATEDLADDVPEGADDVEIKPASRRRPPRHAEREHVVGKELASAAAKAKVRAKVHEAGLDDDQFKAMAMHFTGKESSREWTSADVDKLLVKLGQEAVVEFYADVKGIYDGDGPDSVRGGD